MFVVKILIKKLSNAKFKTFIEKYIGRKLMDGSVIEKHFGVFTFRKVVRNELPIEKSTNFIGFGDTRWKVKIHAENFRGQCDVLNPRNIFT